MKTKILLFVIAISVFSCKKKDEATPSARTSESAYAVGKSYEGGVVIYESGGHGIIAAESDQASNYQWGNLAETLTTQTATGTGQANTTAIVAEQGNGSAVYICDHLTLSGYSDWYLPSKDEMHLVYLQKATLNLVGTYWTSSLVSGGVWAQECTGGSQVQVNTSSNLKIRAVRSF